MTKPNASTEHTPTESARVLLTVRSHQNLVAMRNILEAEAFVCTEANNWRLAVETIESGVDLAIMSEVVLASREAAAQFADKLLNQPKWSNVSVVLLLRGKWRSPSFKSFWRQVSHLRSVILLQTPVKPAVFRSIVRTCLQDRERQYALKAALTELQESNRTLEGFSYTAAHELRNPLSVLSSSFGILERTELSDKQQQLVEVGLRTVRSMDQTLQALLDYGKLQAGEPRDFRAISMESVAIQAKDGLETLIRDRSANISWKALPPVQGNQQLLVQLVSNLIKNAIVHNPQPSLIRLWAEETAEKWTIHVEDNGSGISAENQREIFTLFNRAGKSRAEGSGIGLALCQRIVAQHGGKLSVRSELGRGSDFYFDLLASSA